MPTIWNEHGFRFSFFASDRNEPPHVHVFKDDADGKWWLVPIRESRSNGFKASELRTIRSIIEKRQAFFIEAWNQFFGIA